MQVDVTYKNLEASALIEDAVDKNIEKLERRIKMFRDDESIHLAVNLEKSLHRNEYYCNAHIHLPGHMLKIQGKADSAEKVIHKGFEALSKQLDKLKYKVEKHLQKKSKKLDTDSLG